MLTSWNPPLPKQTRLRMETPSIAPTSDGIYHFTFSNRCQGSKTIGSRRWDGGEAYSLCMYVCMLSSLYPFGIDIKVARSDHTTPYTTPYTIHPIPSHAYPVHVIPKPNNTIHLKHHHPRWDIYPFILLSFCPFEVCKREKEKGKEKVKEGVTFWKRGREESLGMKGVRRKKEGKKEWKKGAGLGRCECCCGERWGEESRAKGEQSRAEQSREFLNRRIRYIVEQSRARALTRIEMDK